MCDVFTRDGIVAAVAGSTSSTSRGAAEQPFLDDDQRLRKARTADLGAAVSPSIGEGTFSTADF